jgi:hypothetical protein
MFEYLVNIIDSIQGIFIKSKECFYAEASDASLTIDAKILSILSATFPRGSEPDDNDNNFQLDVILI